MNAILDIQIRVAAQEAMAALASIDKEIKSLSSGTSAAAGTMSNSFGTMFAGLEKFGKNLQWTGRQLEMSFTLPIVAAGAAATKWAMDNEKAFANITRLYATSGETVQQYTSELKELDTTFTLLSDRFGVNKKDVIDIGTAWAEAGAKGVDLQRSVQATMTAMTLGHLTSTSATQGLITVQAAYHLSTQQMVAALETMNTVEGKVPITLQGLIDGVTRAGGAAFGAKVPFNDLLAMLAALVPATGSATQAGNSIRTMLSRISAPAATTTAALKEMGIQVDTVGWQGLSTMDKLRRVATAFNDLSDAQKGVVSSAIASRWQISRFDVLMDQIGHNTGFYRTALDAASNSQDAHARAVKQLNVELGTNSAHFQQLIQILKNTLSEAIQPMIPVFIILLGYVVEAAHWFANLSPVTQRWALMMLLLLAAIGPVVRYLGAFSTLIGIVGRTMTGLFGVVEFFNTLLFGHAAAAGAAAVAEEAENLAMVRKGGLIRAIASGYEALVTMVGGWISSIWASVTAWLAGDATIQASAAETAAAATAAAEAAALASGAAVTEAAAAASSALELSVLAMEADAAMAAAAIEAEVAAATASIDALLLELTMAEVEAASTSEGVWATAVAQMEIDAMLAAAAWGNAAADIAAEGAAAAAAWEAEFGVAAETVAVEAEVAATGFFSFVSGIGTAIVGYISGAVDAVGGAITGVLDFLGGALVAVGEAAGEALAGVAAVIGLPVEAVVALIAAAIAAVVLLLQQFYHGGIVGFVKDVAGALAQLPGIIASVFTAVVRIVAAAMTQVIQWLSYLNPFARHSPSLVDNVTAGVSVILSQYARLSNIPGLLASAINALKDFNNASAPGQARALEVDRNKQRKDVGEFAPEAIPQLNAMYDAMDKLSAVIPALSDEIAAQGAIVDDWTQKLKTADDALKADNATLNQLRDAASAASDALNAAKNQLSDWQNTAIEGTQAMSDAIFNNEQAQKKLRLEMMKIEDATGPIQAVQDKLSKLQGNIELARGQEASLRAAGAGSDVLSAWDDQINQMTQARDALQSSSSGSLTQLQDLQNQLDALARQGEELNLENSLQFDPLNRQIEQASKNIKEMPFDVILNGVKQSVAEVAKLQANYDAATQAVKDQEKVVAAAQAQRDQIAAQLDIEKQKAQDLADAYREVNDQINAMQSSISDFSSAAAKAKSGGPSPLDAQFAAGAGQNFPDVGGLGNLGSGGGLPDMKKFNADLQKQVQDAIGNIGKVNIFQPFDDMFGNFEARMKSGWHRVVEDIKTPFRDLGSWFDRDVGRPIGSVWNRIAGYVAGAWNNGIFPVLKTIGGYIGGAFGAVWRGLASVVQTVWGWIQAATSLAWKFIQPIFQAIWSFIQTYLVPIFQLIGAVVDIVWAGIAKIITWAWNTIIWPMLKGAAGWIGGAFVFVWQHLGDIISGVWNVITGVISWAWNNIIYPLLKGAANFLSAVFGPVFQVLGNIVSGVWNAISTGADWMWNHVLQPVFNAMVGFFQNEIQPAFQRLSDFIGRIWGGISDTVSRVWNDMMTGAEKAINFVIDVFNTMARAVQAVGNLVGVHVNINPMPHVGAPDNRTASDINQGGGRQGHNLAQGGMIPADVTMGGVYNQARAVIGEGNPMYPEWVIPTDPAFRSRARKLWADVGRQIYADSRDLPKFASGGILNTIRKGAVEGVFAPFLAAADVIINMIPNDTMRAGANKIKNDAYNWAKGADNAAPKMAAGGIIPNIAHNYAMEARVIALRATAIRDAALGRVASVLDMDTHLAGLNSGGGHRGEVLHVSTSSTTTKNYYFLGDLSFPNVKTKDDAKSFIENLEALAS